MKKQKQQQPTKQKKTPAPRFATRHEMFTTANETLIEVSRVEDRMNEKLAQHSRDVHLRCKHANVACWCALSLSIVAIAFALAALSEVFKV